MRVFGMLGVAEFRAMKPSAFYVCFLCRGITDDVAPLRTLQEGWIAGADLDAHGEEPVPPDSPFWTAPNTIVTPPHRRRDAGHGAARRRHRHRQPAAQPGRPPPPRRH
jgi:hypothetical protein